MVLGPGAQKNLTVIKLYTTYVMSRSGLDTKIFQIVIIFNLSFKLLFIKKKVALNILYNVVILF